MKIIEKPVSSLKPYQRNTKKHSQKQVDMVANSIKLTKKLVQPIVIDKNNVVVSGHCRLLAAKQLKMKTVPCVYVDYLTEDEVNAFRIIDNKTNESEWDLELLQDCVLDIQTVDMTAFNFDFDNLSIEVEELKEKEEKGSEKAQYKRANILNLEKGQYEGGNKFDFPELEPVYDLPPIKEWIDFDEVLREQHPEGKGVHFFCDDYKFERMWNNPEKYVDKLRRFACVATPDFSPYGDMPLIAQMWNHYRKHWVGAYMQEHGVTVIPTIRASTDPRSLEWYLDGEPRGGIVIMSSMWTGNEELEDINQKEYAKMKEVLKPCKIFIYGKKGAGKMGILDSDPVEYIARAKFRRVVGEYGET